MNHIPGQLSIADLGTPPWPECFKSCAHFDSHPEFPPDMFPISTMKRCTYHMKDTGTSGEEFWIEVTDNISEMYCKKYERAW